MKPIQIDIPITDASLPGEYVEVTVNDDLLARVDLLPGQTIAPLFLDDGFLDGPFLAQDQFSGFLEDAFLDDPFLSHVSKTVETAPLYFGRYDVAVQVFDALGNPSADPPSTTSLFINTGPTPPSNLRFDSQTGSGPITFAFTPSPEVINA